MTEPDQSIDNDTLADLRRETVSVWNGMAEFWDGIQGDEGNRTHRKLVGPALERLLEVQEGQTILEVGCGNGIFSRRMAALGGSVVAIDASSAFIDIARKRPSEFPDRIAYEQIDGTDLAALLTLGEGKFDSAVSSQVLMDMPTIEPIAAALGRLIKPGGRFVFAIPHPYFNSPYATKVIDEDTQSGDGDLRRYLKITNYIKPIYTRDVAIPGSGRSTYWFHRPLSYYLSVFFEAGFTLDGIEEPTPDQDAASDRPFSWANWSNIPSVFVARLSKV